MKGNGRDNTNETYQKTQLNKRRSKAIGTGPQLGVVKHVDATGGSVIVGSKKLVREGNRKQKVLKGGETRKPWTIDGARNGNKR